MDLVTLQEAKDNLLIDFSDQATDRDLRLKISAASFAVLAYLRARKAAFIPVMDDNGFAETDSSGNIVYETDTNGDRLILPQVKQATLLLVGQMFRDRDGANGADWEPGYLPEPVKSLLYPLRDPALA